MTVSPTARPARVAEMWVRGPTTWTITHDITRYDGPNHLGLWYNALPEHQMALITPGCAALQEELYPLVAVRARALQVRQTHTGAF